MSDRNSKGGRAAQRGRTRKTIVAAAAELLEQGKTPSIQEVADAAEVSRRTVYMYFPTIEQLLVDAALQAVTRDTVDAALAIIDGEEDVELRVETLVRTVHRDIGATEQQGRTLLRLTIDAPRSPDQPLRGYRRVEWIERALAPLRRKIGKRSFERLVTALAILIGWEAMIVARDIRALTLEEAEEVSVWAARALVRSAMAEPETHGPRNAVARKGRATPRR